MNGRLSTPAAIYNNCQLTRCSRQFRILLLHPPFEGHGELRAKLIGDPTLPKGTVLVDGIAFQITKGLASVLHHILKPVRSLPVWADGICINQDDMDEKSDQVNVWLPAPGMLITSSSPERDAPSLGALMGRLGGDHFHDLPGYSVNTQTGKLAFEETEEFRALWETHDLLASSLWWTRAWTAQEVFLPPRVVFFHHAAKPCQISVINRWFSRMWAQTINPKPCCQDAMDIFPPEKLGALWGLFNRFTKIQDRRSMPRRDSDDRDCFYVLLAKFAERECQQGRDRIYSLWSATDASYHHLAPDYTKTDDDVYTSVFESMIREA
ncbi:putative HET domain-containing protein [Colletotrichum sublineola]|uniref:Putative HET domain-containing protein n=1 Tax=Colletotrichum sublineola TaxID=1173701 RepID=A0A066XR98_COLSU|nr:putative HET domain-containing protein [Colletotrichum sublineola]